MTQENEHHYDCLLMKLISGTDGLKKHFKSRYIPISDIIGFDHEKVSFLT